MNAVIGGVGEGGVRGRREGRARPPSVWSLSAAAIVRSLRLTDNSMFGLVLPTLVGIWGAGGGREALPRDRLLAGPAGITVGRCRRARVVAAK